MPKCDPDRWTEDINGKQVHWKLSADGILKVGKVTYGTKRVNETIDQLKQRGRDKFMAALAPTGNFLEPNRRSSHTQSLIPEAVCPHGFLKLLLSPLGVCSQVEPVRAAWTWM